MNFFAICAVFIAFTTIAVVEARVEYRLRLPNPHSAFDTTCSPLGHEACLPGNIRNQFGLDFRAAGYKYTRAFCEQDSDGDGVSNGAELGDPCCVFVPGGTPPARNNDLSHPGKKDSVPTNPKNRKCNNPPPASTQNANKTANGNNAAANGNGNGSNAGDFVAAPKSPAPSIVSKPSAAPSPAAKTQQRKVDAETKPNPAWVEIPGSKFNNPISAAPTPLPPSATASNTVYPTPTTSPSAGGSGLISVDPSSSPSVSTPAANPAAVDAATEASAAPAAADLSSTPSASPGEQVPLVSPGNNASAATCFPADATVMLSTGERINMDSLKVGDRVQVGQNSYSEVVMFTHALPHVVNKFISISTSAEKLALTPGHYLYVNGNLVAAEKVRVGDTLQGSVCTAVGVLKIETVKLRGLYNPQTAHGDIIVNGIRTSTYTETVDMHIAHAALAPFRALFTFTGLFTRALEKGVF